MPNVIVDRYRKALAAQGLTDPRPDAFVTLDLGKAAEQDNRALFDENPDFAEEYRQVREANAPSLAGEAGQAITSGFKGLGATALGGAALATGSDYLADKARQLDRSAAEDAPTISTLEDIAPGEQSTAKKILSKDAVRYGVSKVAGAVPSIIEAMGLAGAGAVAGSAVEPGVGTLAGAAEGAVEGVLGRGMIKNAIRSLLAKGAAEESVAEALAKKGLINEASEAGIADAIRGGSQQVADIVSQQAKQIAARRAGTIVNAANSYGLSAGEIYNDTGDRGISAGLGAIAALPDTILPTVLLHKLFPNVALAEAKEQGKKYLARLGEEALKTVGIEGSTEGFQEAVGVVARNLKVGRDPLDFDDADWRRIREASIAGAAGGLLAAPGAAMHGGPTVEPTAAPKPAAEIPVSAPIETAPETQPAPAVVPPEQRVALMEPDEQKARFAELSAKGTAMTPDEFAEFDVLQAMVGEAQPTPAITEPSAVPTPSESEVAPALLSEPIVKPDEVPLTADGDAPAPEWMKSNIATLAGAIDPAIAAKIEELSAQRMTARQVAKEVGVDEDSVRAVRMQRGIPPMTNGAGMVQSPNPEFETWLSNRKPPEAAVTEAPPAPSAQGNPDFLAPAGESVLPQVAAAPEAAAATPIETLAEVPTQAPITARAAPTLEQRLREELTVSPKFAFGKVNEGAGVTVDLRAEPRFDALTPDQAARLPVVNALDDSGNKTKTRVAVVLEAPDGHYVQAGLLTAQELAKAGTEGKARGPGVQLFAKESRKGGAYEKVIVENGRKPALLADVVAAGYKLRAIVHFDTEPGVIFQRFKNAAEYDAAYAGTERTTGKGTKIAPTGNAGQGIERASLAKRVAELDRKIESAAQQYETTDDPAAKAELKDEIDFLYDEKSKLESAGQSMTGNATDPRLMTEQSAPTPVAIEANRANQFAAATAGIRQAGGKVELFAKTFLQSSLRDVLEKLPQTPKIAEQLAALDRVRGVTYSPGHIAIGLENVQHASVADLVTLIHEAGHATLASAGPEMQGKVLRAVDGAFAELSGKLAASQEKTGVREVIRGDPEELIVSTIAQKLAIEGVPESPSLARAIYQWAKDLYFRLAMGVQSAFGMEPSGKLALDWFENQMRRLVGGDYDYRLGNLWAKLQPEHNVEQFGRFAGAENGSTPGHVVDFVDPLTEKMRQPMADLSTVDGASWNLKFATDEDPAIGAELDIPATEARARWNAAAINEEAELAEKIFKETAPKGMSFEQFWKITGRGDEPKLRLAVIANGLPGAETARIGGERMTEVMNGLARVEAMRLVRNWEQQNLRHIAKSQEVTAKAGTALKEQASLVNKREKDLRNADMHQATLSDKLKGMIREMAKGMQRGLNTAFASGELAQAVREAEGIAEEDAIPQRYQDAFKAILADEIPIFEYLDGIASLDFDLKDMTVAEIKRGIRDSAEGNPALAKLVQPKNKPLFVALAVLAKKNAQQIDQIQLRRASQAQFIALHGELADIRQASEERLAEMAKAMRENTKAVTFADRIKRGYVEERTKLRRLSTTIKLAEERRVLAEKANELITAKREEMEVAGMSAPSEWLPSEGAKWTAMRQGEDGTWSSVERELRFTPEGPAVNADQVRADLAANWQWLKDNAAKAGSKLYESVKKQTGEIAMLDVQRQYQEGWVHLLDKMIAPTGQQLLQSGHAPGARADQMLKKFQFINFSHWHGDLENLSFHWTDALRKVEAASGIKDHGQFFAQVYDPVLYLMQTETGLDEGPALREAARAARRRIPGTPAENFDEVFKDFLRRTKAVSERVVQIAEQNGLFVADPRLGGELRRAVAQGWITVMRRVDSAAVATIVRDMDKAGWKLEFQDEQGESVKETFDQAAGGNSPRRVVASTSFDALMPDKAETPEDEQARVAVISDPNSFRSAISGFFTPGIIGRWLEPFINKPGEPLFSHNGESIDQSDVQRAWQDSGGDVARWVDELSNYVRLTVDEDTNEKLDVLPAFRASMLKQLDGLFLMESRTAYEASQAKNLFDPMGPKGHIVMDARLNDLIPPEHLQHMVFDPSSAKNLLATVAFHAAFGRNGESMTRALDELRGNLTARKQQFEQLTGTTKAARKADAAAKGLAYKELETAARTFENVMSSQESLKAQFGFGAQAGVLGDLRTGMEALHFVVGQTVNNPKTGLLNLLQLTQRAIARRSLGPSVLKGTAQATGEFSKQVLGSFLENFGLHVMRASEHAKDIGGVHGQAFGQLPRSVAMSDIGRRGNMQGEPAVRTLRKIRDFQRHGVQPGFGESKEFGKFNVIPGISGVMGTISNWAAVANGTAEVRSVESIVSKAVKYFAAHPEDAANPAFRLTAKALGMENKVWFDDSGSFTYFRNKLVEYGIGNLEDVARAASDRQTKGEPTLTKEQAIKVAMMSGNELDLMAGINTNPASWNTNPVLKFMTPLLGWPIRQMNHVHVAMKTAEGRQTVLSTLKALGILAAWSLPMGLAFTLLTDQYDEKILKKKSGLGDISTASGVLQRLSRAGNIYGLGADFVAQSLTSLDPTSGQRPFSLDSRVLAFSQLMNAQQAISNFINTGGATTWATVEKPLVMAMGGNGAIHALDVFNGLLGLDNSESRMVQRTNAQQWLRTAGREAGMEIRRSGGASVSPTPVSIWVREMQLAAYANDRMDFLDAYRKAIDAAREGGENDPEKKVLESWKSRDPLEVFRTKPTDTEMRKIYSAMNDEGQHAVREALTLYQQYSTLIEPTAGEKYATRTIKQLQRPPGGTPEQMRKRLASTTLFAR